MEQRRIRLRVAYDGTAYCGWQIQNEKPTIERELNQSIRELVGEDIKVIGASRTDAGVHAKANIAVFDTTFPIQPASFAQALNHRLPIDIRIQESDEVALNWHPRRVPCQKTYTYRILCTPIQDPTRRLYTYHLYRPLDVAAMQAAMTLLCGEHDFGSFCNHRREEKHIANSFVHSNIRTIYRADLTINRDEIELTFSGNGFLYNMIRILVGTLIEIGQGKRSVDSIRTLLEVPDRTGAGPTAPAHALTLMDYVYSPHPPPSA
jgi:tRNA pseudouridine38-40 synthase